jgi:hypothetical protein
MKTDWETINPNPMSNEATRLAVMENEVETIKDNQRIMFKKLESIQRFQWMSMGGLAILELLLRHGTTQ